jgi:hypothetical protein
MDCWEDAVEERSPEFGLHFVFGRLHCGEIRSRWGDGGLRFGGNFEVNFGKAE